MTVRLVGAGPGDPGLITARGLERIRACDVLVHDRLVSPELVAEAPGDALVIDRDSLDQARVNELLVAYGREGLDVVRLKGGDPFVFGRGGEEALALIRAGVEVEVVPGVSSFAAVPSAAGIPVTHRGVASQVTVVAGHDADALDFAALAAARGTLVFFMALAQLPRIARRLVEHGKDPATPAAVIAEGTLPGQQATVAPLSEIAVAAAELPSPALVVVGDVVSLAAELRAGRARGSRVTVEFRRISALPPYAFAEIDRLKLELRRAGEDVIDLGFGNPDLPSPPEAVAKLQEAAAKERNHRYSSSRGIPRLRAAVCDLYRRRFGVELDPETQALTTIGAKEGLSHLMWVLVQPGDVAVVPTPTYPIHTYAPVLAGATVVQAPVDGGFAAFEEAFASAPARPRVIVLSYPHNPTTTVAEPDLFERAVAFARENEVLIAHDFAYADIAFDGYRPPSILEVEGATDVAVELYTLTKGFSMAGWRVGFLLGNAEVVGALARLKSYLDYGTFQPIQIAAIVAMNEAPGYPEEITEVYRGRRDALCRGLARIGWEIEPPRGTMFVWAEIPEPYRAEGSQAFAVRLAREAHVAVSPGAGFGPGGEGYVRFALVENEQRIAQATRGIRRALSELESPARAPR